MNRMPLLERLAAWLADGPRQIGQVLISPIGVDGFALCHIDDADATNLTISREPNAARAIAMSDKGGAYRPLKTAPTLRRGWRLELRTLAEVRDALEFLYPAMTGLLREWEAGDLPVTTLRETLARQSGMYAVTRKLTDEQAQELIVDFCKSDGSCLKTILWQIAPGIPVATLPPSKFDLGLQQAAPSFAKPLPMLCQEPCHLLVAQAREVVKRALAIGVIFCISFGALMSGACGAEPAIAKAATAIAPEKGVGFSIPSYPLPKSEQQIAYFRDMRSLGATWVRFDLPWNAIQPESADKFRWGTYDTLVENALAAGLKIDAVLTFTPAWARAQGAAPNDSSAPPKSPELYAAYATAVVQHYAGKLASVEIWNEPNIYQFWKPIPDASQYVPILKAAYLAIKAVDPKLTVLSAGLSASFDDHKTHHYIDQRTYLTQMYALGAKGFFDALAFHPYSYPIPPGTYEVYSAWSSMADTPKNLRAIMAANGDGEKPIWITEYGAPTDGPEAEGATCDSFIYTGRRKVDECLQAKILSEAIDLTKGNALMGPLFLYSYIDRGTSTKSQENFYGVLKFDGTRKASYDAVKAAIARQSGKP